MAGGGWPKLPYGLDQHIYALPYAILGGIMTWTVGMNPFGILAGSALSYATAFLAKRTGHGQYFLPFSAQRVEAERLDFLVKLAFGRDPRVVPSNFPLDVLRRNITSYGERKLFLRNIFGMFVTGFGVGLGAMAIALYTGYYVVAGLLALSTAAKALSYYIGYLVTKDPNRRTFFGEIITGVLGGIGLVLSALMVWKKKK